MSKSCVDTYVDKEGDYTEYIHSLCIKVGAEV